MKQGYGYFRDNPRLTAPELLRYDACVPVTFGLDPEPDGGHRPPDASRRRLRRAHARRLLRAKSVELLSHLHREIVPKRGLSLDYDRPFVTIYLNDPAITREMHRRTELCVPVLPVRMPLSSNDDDAGQADRSHRFPGDLTAGRLAG